MISKETIEEVKARAKIADIVSESVELKRQAGRYLGLCPFHSEKSPSFHVREDDGYYHCFGCGKSGNVFSFLMEIKGLTFPESIEYLAEKYGIEVKRTNSIVKSSEKNDIKKKLYELNDFALKFFKETLQQKDPKVIEYAKSRQLKKEAFSNFGIGFAPLGNLFVKAALSAKFTEELLLKSGLVKRNDKGMLYDALRARLVFPIYIDAKKIAGFGGRIIPSFCREDEKPPKYLNSPESAVYQKSQILYGLPQAIDAIRSTGEVYVVEGYLDVIGLWQAGVKNAVATCGTALTEEHVQKLSRIAKKVVMLFDGDDAGRNAAGKSFVTFVKAPIDVWAVYLPKSEDPDSIAKLYQDKTSAYLKDLPRVSLLDAFIDLQLRNLKEESVEKLGSNSIGVITTELKKIFSTVKDRAVLDVLIRQASHRLRVSESSFANLNSTATSSISVEKNNLTETQADLTMQVEVSSLPNLDRQILLIVMAKREIYVDKILKNGVLIDALMPQTISFIQELAQIIDLNKDPEHQKLSIKSLLNLMGKSWVNSWKQAFKLAEDKDTNFERNFTECVENISKENQKKYIETLQRQVQFAKTDEEKMQLTQQVLELQRKVG
jgi:DNA primase